MIIGHLKEGDKGGEKRVYIWSSVSNRAIPCNIGYHLLILVMVFLLHSITLMILH